LNLVASCGRTSIRQVCFLWNFLLPSTTLFRFSYCRNAGNSCLPNLPIASFKSSNSAAVESAISASSSMPRRASLLRLRRVGRSEVCSRPTCRINASGRRSIRSRASKVSPSFPPPALPQAASWPGLTRARRRTFLPYVPGLLRASPHQGAGAPLNSFSSWPSLVIPMIASHVWPRGRVELLETPF
jgi:hypothetical protein